VQQCAYPDASKQCSYYERYGSSRGSVMVVAVQAMESFLFGRKIPDWADCFTRLLDFPERIVGKNFFI
jgi:hypothetical protein